MDYNKFKLKKLVISMLAVADFDKLTDKLYIAICGNFTRKRPTKENKGKNTFPDSYLEK